MDKPTKRAIARPNRGPVYWWTFFKAVSDDAEASSYILPESSGPQLDTMQEARELAEIFMALFSDLKELTKFTPADDEGRCSWCDARLDDADEQASWNPDGHGIGCVFARAIRYGALAIEDDPA